ncbi:MAG: M48 family metallopeptidase [Proteobacteria bacterium]|nr:M48 family metallopeptidase [Pseudomonadota bacterium]
MHGLLRRLIAPSPALPVARVEAIALQLPDGRRIDIHPIRHPRARRIKLTVNERGVRLTLPMRASLRAADAFVHAHRDWLAVQWQRWSAHTRDVGLTREATSIPLHAVDVALRREAGRYAHVRCDPVDGAVVLALPPTATDACRQRALRDFYLAQARADVGRWLPKYLPSFPRAPSAIRIRPLSSLWGSLSARDGLSLDLALVLGEPAAFEYVLVHELCHLIHRHHQRAFWREVEARGVDWRAQRDYLHAHGAALKARLRALIAG